MSEGLLSGTSPDSYDAAYDLLRVGAGRFDLKNSCLIELSGDDRKGWLQGQVTNDLRSVQDGDSISFCICSPTGHILAVCDLWALPDRYLIRAHRLSMDAILARVEQNVIMEHVVAQNLTPTYRLVSVQGPEATRELRALLELPQLDAGTSTMDGDEVICLRSNRTGLGGWDLLLPTKAKKAVKTLEAAFELVPEDVFDAARLEAGIPRFGTDMNERTLPPEMGPAFEAKNLSYKKGCYTGQEVLMRIHSRGHTNRTWMGLVSDTPMRAGQTIGHLKRDDAGVVTSAAFSPQFGYIAGAMLRNEAAFDGEIIRIIDGDQGFEAEVRPFPILLVA